MERIPRILVFASGDAKGGGSGFQEMVEYTRTGPPVLRAEIVGVVSNHKNGGVRKRADNLKIPFEHWSGPFDANVYQHFVKKFRAEWVMLSGWLKLVRGLNPKRTVNIHPGPLPEFGGPGMFGHHVHEAVIRAFIGNKVTQSAVSMHFVTEPRSKKDYDKGPVIASFPVFIRPDDTAESLAKRVNEVERVMQSRVLNLVIHGNIYLGDDGKKVWHIGREVF